MSEYPPDLTGTVVAVHRAATYEFSKTTVATINLIAGLGVEDDVPPGVLGENVTTAGIDLIGLPVGTLLRLGQNALIAITGLRSPRPDAARTSLNVRYHPRARRPARQHGQHGRRRQHWSDVHLC